MSKIIANGITLNYELSGSGDPLLLLHGFLGTRHVWRKVEPILSRHFTVITPDMRGYGDSDKPDSGYDAESLAEDLHALSQALQANRLHIIAHDMGAPPALLFAAKYPGEAATLAYVEEPVLTNTCLRQTIQFSPQGTRKGGLWWWMFALASDMPERLIDGKEREFLSWFYENYAASPEAVEISAVNEYLRTFRGTRGVAGAWGVYRAIWDSVRQTEALETYPVQLPILAVGGEASMGAHVAEMLRTVAKQVQPLTIEECGHFVPEEQPDAFCEAWLSFARSAGALE